MNKSPEPKVRGFLLLKKLNNLYNQFMETEINNRLTEIEIKLSYLEDFMNKIQKITVEHTETIDRLKAENRALKAKLSELIESQEDEIPNRKPPHY